MRAVLRVLLALTCMTGEIAAAASPEETYREAYERLNAEYDEFKVEEEASSPILRAFWDAADGLLSARGPKALTQVLPVDFLPLRQETMLVAVTWEQFGHLAVVENGKVVWSSSTDQSAPGCWRGAPGRPCSMTGIGIQSPGIGLLPAEPGGAPRFFVQADYAQFAGGTRGHQLSLWRWNGSKAEVFYTVDFVTGGDAAQGVVLVGDVLEITRKAFWSRLSVCGSCSGHQVRHRLRVTPTGIEHIGTDSLTPELDTVDELLVRLAENQATDDISTPEAAAMLKTSWHGNLFIMDPIVASNAACIAPDDNPALTFHFAPGPVARIAAIEPGRCG